MKIDKRSRGQKNKDRHKEQIINKRLFNPTYVECRICGLNGATWCEGCRMYTCYLCSEYGTCMCS